MIARVLAAAGTCATLLVVLSACGQVEDRTTTGSTREETTVPDGGSASNQDKSNASDNSPPPVPTNDWNRGVVERVVVAQLVIETDPPGANVGVGAKGVNSVVDWSTEREGGVTPCTIALLAEDVDAMGGIAVRVRKDGYYDWAGGLSDGLRKIEERGTYRLNPGLIRLRRIGE